MDFPTLSEKAEYIASQRQCLLKQWHRYCNTLTKGVTLSKARLHQTINSDPDEGLCFCLFGYFIIRIRLADGFNSHTIEYSLEERNNNHKVLITSAVIDNKGSIDGIIDSGNRQQVLEHYLGLVHPVYDRIIHALNEHLPLSVASFPQLARR